MVSDHRPQTQTPDPDVTDSKMDEVKDDHKLKGKTNFISGKHEFDHVAEANDILEYLTGDKVVPPKPKKEDYFVKPTKADSRRPIQAKKTAQTFTPSTDDDDKTDDAQTIRMSTNNTL